jgi:hypothetical protein
VAEGVHVQGTLREHPLRETQGYKVPLNEDGLSGDCRLSPRASLCAPSSALLSPGLMQDSMDPSDLFPGLGLSQKGLSNTLD